VERALLCSRNCCFRDLRLQPVQSRVQPGSDKTCIPFTLQALAPCFAHLKVLLLTGGQASLKAGLVPQLSGLEQLHLFHTALTTDAATAFSKLRSLHGLVIGGPASAEVGRKGWSSLVGHGPLSSVLMRQHAVFQLAVVVV
jgi:hypothetical protein